MRVDGLVLTLAKIEETRILVISSAVLPSVLVARHVFLGWHLNSMVPLAADDHKNVLQIFCQNRLFFVALEQPVKVVHLALLLNRQFLPKESHLIHNVRNEVELERVLLRIDIVRNGSVTHLKQLLILEVEQDASEFFLEALNSVLLALLVLELGVGAHVYFLLVLQLGLLLRNLTLSVQIVKLVDAALTLGCGRSLRSSDWAPVLLDLRVGRRLLFLVLLSQLLLALGVESLVDRCSLAVLHALDDLLRQVVDGRLRLQLLQLILNRILLRFELFHAAVFEEPLLIAEETVQVAHLLTVTIDHGATRLERVGSECATVELLLGLHLASVLEVLFADLAEDVFTHHVLLMAHAAMLCEQSFLVLREIILTTHVDLGKSLLKGRHFEAPDTVRREAAPLLACPLRGRRGITS